MHSSDKCDLPKPSNLTDKSKVKCANCKQNHTANYGGCSSRTEYIKRKSDFNNKQTKSSNHYIKTVNMHADSANYNGKPNFPNLQPSRTKSNFFQRFNGPQQNTRTTSYSNQVKTLNTNSTNTINHNENNSNDLLSAHTLLNIFKEIVNKLKFCKNRFEQLEMIADLAMTYIIGPDGSP